MVQLKEIALFGADGQIGSCILAAMLKAESFNITAFVEPGGELHHGQAKESLQVKEIDLQKASREDLTSALQNHDAVVSALNGPALQAQSLIQDAAADAGVQRFYPSEFGMHIIYRKPNDLQGYVHPLWDSKARANEACLLHPAVLEGRMSYTLIGCGDFYNQVREKVWCPWTQTDVEKYVIHAVGDPDMRSDWTHLDDFAAFLVASLKNPGKSRNTILNIVSDTTSPIDIARGLKLATGKEVKVNVIPVEVMHSIVASPDAAPKEWRESAFPVDFWMLVKGAQGQGRFRRPPGQVHNHLFPTVQTTTLGKYFDQVHRGRQM
jgi:uncharacterized protein YbjT (DUF2867 family)